MATFYERDILNTLRDAQRPMRMREIVDLIAPNSYGAYGSIGNALTHLYRAGRVSRTKPGRWYEYVYVDKPRYAKITLHGGASYVQPLDQVVAALLADLDGAGVGTKWTIELVEMTRAEYEALPEFQGH